MQITFTEINGFRGPIDYSHIFSGDPVEVLSGHDEMHACKIMLSQMYKCFPGCKVRNFSPKDINNEGIANVTLHIIADDNSFIVVNKALRKDCGSKTDLSGLTGYFSGIKEKIDQDKSDPLPVIAYYNAKDCKYDTDPYVKNFTDVFPRYRIYDPESVADVTTFKHFFNWFELAEDNERRMKCKLNQFELESNDVKFVRDILTKCSRHYDIETSVCPWSFTLSKKDDNSTVDIMEIDEAERFEILLFCDIASRIAEANIRDNKPIICRPEESTGIIMVDNMSMIIGEDKIEDFGKKLHEIFPNMQFLICK